MLAIRLAARGVSVTGVDPAVASLEVARAKPNAERVTWLLADATSLPEMAVDLAIMTGNVAQIFLTDEQVRMGYVLLCQARPQSDCVIQICTEDEVDQL